MITILGAGGAIANGIATILTAQNRPLRLVSRRAHAASASAEVITADLTDKDQTLQAIAGSSTVLLLAGLQYDRKIWAEQWPRIMANTIEGCKRAGARLLFFDNVYMYGRVSGPMTEETPFRPCSRKGEVRARIATSLIDEWKAGNLTAMIARSADFYGPDTPNGLLNILVFDPLSKGQKASWLIDDSLPHSLTYTPDASQAVVTLADTESAWNQTWHLPTAPHPLTGNALISMAAAELRVAPSYRVLSRPMLRVFGLFKPVVGEMVEMLYQNDSAYIFDSSKFARAFGFSGTPYPDGIRATAASFRKASPPMS
jgi:nucleoside-diphosphate-sugar epimerase